MALKPIAHVLTSQLSLSCCADAINEEMPGDDAGIISALLKTRHCEQKLTLMIDFVRPRRLYDFSAVVAAAELSLMSGM